MVQSHQKLAMPSAQVADSSVVHDQHDLSPFLQADVVPADVTPRPQQPQQQQQHPKQTQHSSSRKTPNAFARLFCCKAPATHENTEEHVNGVRAAQSPMQSIRSQHSWSRVHTHADKQHLQAAPSSEYYDARSQASDITPQHSLERSSPAPSGLAHQYSVPQELPHWVPPQPLLFAPPGLKFVPVPAVTGFAGIWELIKERTTPHPQPIDVMTGASAVVRKIHASVPGIVIEEDERYVKMIAQPSFLPKGIPAAHVETYDKTHATAPTWMPRRDVRLGTGHGHVYYTEDGQMIIRHETWSVFGRKPDYIVEDYMSLEEEGTVIVDRMCAQNFRTGQRAEQLQVVRLVSRPGEA